MFPSYHHVIYNCIQWSISNVYLTCIVRVTYM